MVYGLGEYGGCYGVLVYLFNVVGCLVCICDYCGYGNLGGWQGSLIQLDDLLWDLKQIFDDFSCCIQCMLLLFGYSMGGLVVVWFVIGGFSLVWVLVLFLLVLVLDLLGWQWLLLKVLLVIVLGLVLLIVLLVECILYDLYEVWVYWQDLFNYGKIVLCMFNFMFDVMYYVVCDVG